MHGYEFWADYFRRVFTPQIDAFAGSLSGRVLPAFDNIDEEGRQIEEEEYRRLCSLPEYNDAPDLAALAEQAHDHAITYYVTMYEVVQGIVNLFAVGLWHLFEQQFAYFARRALPYSWDPPNPPFSDVKGALSEMTIDITRLPSYPKVDELRLLANCAKHGDVDSCAKLRAKRPDLFEPEHHRDLPRLPAVTPVITPLGGEDLYLSAEGFKEYADAIKALWSDLGALLEGAPAGGRLP